MKIIEDFEEAVREHAFKGASAPEDHEAIQVRYIASKTRLEEYIKRLHSKDILHVDTIRAKLIILGDEPEDQK